MEKIDKREKKHKRHLRIRKKIHGTPLRPRLFVFRSAKHIYAQLIDDENNKILAQANDTELVKKGEIRDKKLKGNLKGKKIIAYEVGKLIAKKAIEKNINVVVFDRGGYKYHGRVKEFAQGARDGGLKF